MNSVNVMFSAVRRLEEEGVCNSNFSTYWDLRRSVRNYGCP